MWIILASCCFESGRLGKECRFSFFSGVFRGVEKRLTDLSTVLSLKYCMCFSENVWLGERVFFFNMCFYFGDSWEDIGREIAFAFLPSAKKTVEVIDNTPN